MYTRQQFSRDSSRLSEGTFSQDMLKKNIEEHDMSGKYFHKPERINTRPSTADSRKSSFLDLTNRREKDGFIRFKVHFL